MQVIDQAEHEQHLLKSNSEMKTLHKLHTKNYEPFQSP